jgi:hypothetical protein
VDALNPAGHGIAVEVGEDWVELIDTLAAGNPTVRFTKDEFAAFVEAARRGDFDQENLDGPRRDVVPE